jgi:hypothetical protein
MPARPVLLIVGVVIALALLSRVLALHWLPYPLRTQAAKEAEAFECSRTGIMMGECLQARYRWPALDAASAALGELRRQQTGR